MDQKVSLSISKVFIIFLFFTYFSSIAFSQNNASKKIVMETSATELFESDVFELTVSIENFDFNNISVSPPNFEKYFSHISGPSQSHSTSIINGKRSESITLTYQFAPKKVGKLTIEPFVVIEKSKNYKSNKLKLDVVKENKGKKKNSSKDLFVMVSASNKTPFLGERIKIDYTLYVKQKFNIRMPTIKETPKAKGFVKDEVKYDRNKAGTLVQKIYKGEKYSTLPIKTLWLTPSSVGEQKIDQLVLNVPIEQKNNKRKKNKRKRSSFFNDPFFNDDVFSGFTKFVDKIIKSRSLKIDVKQFPNKNRPKHFEGIVGNFKLKTTISKTESEINDAITIKSVITGTGNLSDIKELKFNIPEDFETYEATKKIKFNSASKNSGRLTFEQIIIPRIAGLQKITATSLTYFNPKTKNYKTISGNDFEVLVKEGKKGINNRNFSLSNSSFTKKEVSLLGEDIRYIIKQNQKFYDKDDKMNNFYNLYIYILLFIMMPILSFIAKKTIIKNHNNKTLVRSKKASSFANKRLKKAEKFKNNDNYKDFYKSIEDAIFQFLADKFNISDKGIVIDQLTNQLNEKGVKEKTLILLSNILNKCSQIQYSPISHNKDEMSVDIEKSKQLLLELNGVLK